MKLCRRIILCLLSFALASSIMCGMFAVHSAAFTKTGDQRMDIVSVAEEEVGNSGEIKKRNKYTLGIGYVPGFADDGYGYDWCCAFVGWCAKTAGISSGIVNRATGTYSQKSFYVNQGVWYASKAHGGTYTPRRGDLIYFQWDGKASGTPSHVGIVSGFDGSNVYTIEGNTKSDGKYTYVAKKQYKVTSQYIMGYAVPKYTGSCEYIDIGDDLYAVVLNDYHWKPIADNGWNQPVTITYEYHEYYNRLLWHFVKNADGSYRIIGCNMGYYLTHSSAGEAYIQQFSSETNTSWYIARNPSGAYYIMSKDSGKVLELPDNSFYDGAKIRVNEKNGSYAQNFSIYKLELPRDNIDYTFTADKTTVRVGENVTLTVSGTIPYVNKIRFHYISPDGYDCEYSVGGTGVLATDTFYPHVAGKYVFYVEVYNPLTSEIGSPTHKSVTINVLPQTEDIGSFTVSGIPDQTYTGSAIKPTVTVTDGSRTLTSGTDYNVSYSDNINAGTATVTITGKGSYTGTKTATFRIAAKSISGAKLSSIADQTYTGSALRPAVTVTDGSKALTKDTDYTVSYKNNTNVGTATVTVTGKGNYTGTKTATFRIVSAKPAAPVVTATPGDGKITLSWKAVANAAGYGIHRYNANGTYTRVNLNVTSTSYTISGLTNGTKYTYLVQAVTADNKWSESGAAHHVSATPVSSKPAAPVVTATPGDKQIMLTWEAVPTAAGYGIHRYNANGTYTRINLNVKTTSYTISGLTNGTKYTYLVQAFTADNKWSESGAAHHVSATPVSSKPAAPVVTATPGDGKITLTWAAVPNAAGYGIHRYNANGTYTRVNLNVKTTSYTISGLTNGTKYTYLVQAFTADNKWSEVNTAYHASATPVSSKPAAPVVTATPGDGEITLTWAAVPNAAGYAIHRYNANGSYTRVNLNVTSTSYTIGGLTNGTKYTYLVQAFTADNKWSEVNTAYHASATPNA